MSEHKGIWLAPEDPELAEKDGALVYAAPDPANQEDAAYCHLGDAMRSVLQALAATLDEPIMQQLGALLYQIRRVQAKLELPE